jgi:hypothetical protein
MNAGTENRKKTIAAGALGAVGLVCIYLIYSQLFGGNTPAPTAPPVITNTTPVATVSNTSSNAGTNQNMPGGNAPGVAAVKLASTSESLDPTLHEAAMLRTESLVYTGTGRNIFSANSAPPPVAKVIVPRFSPRPVHTGPPPPPVYTGPPPPPPINLKFFGTAEREHGPLQAFLLSGEDVYLAAEGDIVARKYKIGRITANNVQVTDLVNNNTQTLPIQRN